MSAAQSLYHQPLVPRPRSINPSARIIEAYFGEVDLDALLRPATDRNGPAPFPETLATGDGNAGHVSRSHSTLLTFDGPVDWAGFGTWLSMLLHARGEDVLRVKGLLDVVGETGPILLNGVQHVMHPPNHLQEWPDEDRRSRIIFITRGIRSEELVPLLEAFRNVLGAGPRLLEANAPV